MQSMLGQPKKHDRESTVSGNLKLLKSQDMSTKPTIPPFFMCSGICNHRCPLLDSFYVRPRFRLKKKEIASERSAIGVLEGETWLFALKRTFCLGF